MIAKPEKNYITMSDVKEQGWTSTMINRFLPKPDKIKRNPYYKCVAPMKLYEKAKVEEIEKTEQFKKAYEKAQQRRKSCKKAIETKRDKLMSYVESINVDIPEKDINVVRKNAIDSYNDWQFSRMDSSFFASESSDPDFLDRITVNYLRHEMTQYERQLYMIKGKTGKVKAYSKLKRKILDAIAQVYPDLALECISQSAFLD
jgi:hypothetical protein